MSQLPVILYKIPDEALNLYKGIVAKIPQGMLLSLSKWTVSFLQSLATRKQPWDKIKSDMILKGLGNKEYIYSIDKWDSYIKYFDDEIDKIEKISKGDLIDLRAAETVEMKKGDFKLIKLFQISLT